MKGVVLAAGKGSRIKELQLVHKSFACIQKKYAIEYSLDLLRNEGGRCLVSQIVIVVGHNAQSIIDYVGNNYKGIPVEYVFQNELKGIAHAIKTAKDAINDDFIMCLADEVLINPRLEQMCDFFDLKKASCVCGTVFDENDYSMKPIAYSIEEGLIESVREKPENYENGYRGIGECIFSHKCLSLLDSLKPNRIRGEFEMGDWIQMVIEHYGGVYPFVLADAYANINYSKDIIEAERLLEGL